MDGEQSINEAKEMKMLEKGTDRLGEPMNGTAMEAKRNVEWEIRRKPWAECSIEEKLEKLRIAAQEERRHSGYVSRTAHNALRLAEEHQHAHDGEVLKPARDRNGGAEAMAGSMDPLA